MRAIWVSRIVADPHILSTWGRGGGGQGAGDRGAADRGTADQETAELTASYWRAYDERMMTVGFRDVARRFPGLVGQAIRLGWSASPLDTAATIGLNIVSGVFGGHAVEATGGGRRGGRGGGGGRRGGSRWWTRSSRSGCTT